MNKEEWQDIADHPGYQISNNARVRSFWKKVSLGRGNGFAYVISDEPHILRELLNNNGYYVVSVGRKAKYLVHRLVLSHFGEPMPFPGANALHKNDVPTDNRLANLYWGSQKDNAEDCTRNGHRVFGEARSDLTEKDVRAIHKEYAEGGTLRGIAAKYGVSSTCVAHIANGTYWKHLELTPISKVPARGRRRAS